MALRRTGRILAVAVFLGLILLWVVIDLATWAGSGEPQLSINLAIDSVFISFVVLAWLALYLPHASRLRAARKAGNAVLSVRGNDELRSLLDRVLVGTTMTAGTYKGRIRFGGIFELGGSGIVLWTGWGRRAGTIERNSLDVVKVSSRQEGFFAVQAIEVVPVDGNRARFLLTDINSGLFICTQAEVEIAVETLRHFLAPAATPPPNDVG